MKRQSWAQKLVEEMAEACGSWLTVHSCCRCLFLVGLLSLHCQPSCTGESTFGLYMYISCKGTQNLRYPNAVEKFFSLHGIGLRLHVEGEYAFSHHEIIYPSYRTTLPLPSNPRLDGRRSLLIWQSNRLSFTVQPWVGR